ncbi:hypothetical protein C8Q75DRAFT_268833 [Abortiporus biennis]|nr:hypothetical protein C8Q75DRAFT_268833 [Abortiporus biennis]
MTRRTKQWHTGWQLFRARKLNSLNIHLAAHNLEQRTSSEHRQAHKQTASRSSHPLLKELPLALYIPHTLPRLPRVSLSSSSLPSFADFLPMADLYPTYGHGNRSAYAQRQDAPQQSYHLQTSSTSIVYPPPLITNQQPPMSDDHSPNHHDSPSQSPTSQSPKQESPSAPKSDGMPQQAAKPQATFLTKLYA